MLAADVGHPAAALGLVQGAQNLLFGMTLLRHFRVLLALFQKTTLKAHDSTYHWRDFRVLGQFMKSWSGELPSSSKAVCTTTKRPPGRNSCARNERKAFQSCALCHSKSALAALPLAAGKKWSGIVVGT